MKTFARVVRTWTGAENGRWVTKRLAPTIVELLAEGSGYAMVRFKGAYPQVVPSVDVIDRTRAASWSKAIAILGSDAKIES